MNDAFQKLKGQKTNPGDEKDLREQIHAWKSFLRDYPENPHRLQVVEKISELEGMVKELIAKKEFDDVQNDVRQRVKGGNFADALAVLEKYSGKGELETQSEKLKKQTQESAQGNIQKVLTETTSLAQNKKFSNALQILKEAQKKQLFMYQETIAKKITEIQREAHTHEWLKIATETLNELCPRILEKDYAGAVEIIQQKETLSPKFQNEFAAWKKDIEGLEKLWQGLELAFHQRKGKSWVVRLENQPKITIKISHFKPSKIPGKELLYSTISGNLKNIRLEELSFESLRELLEEVVPMDSIERRVQLAIFFLQWKGAKTLEEAVPEIKNFSMTYQIFGLYMVSIARYAIAKRNVPLFSRMVEDLKKYYGDTEIFEANQGNLAEKLWECAQELEKKDKKSARKVLQLLAEYLKNTSRGKEAARALKK
jgi:hypothetical protein